MAGLLSLIQAAGQTKIPFDQLVQEYSQGQAPQMQPEPNRVSAPVVPDTGPSTAVPASEAPRMTKKKRGGILGTLESIFMPDPGSLWASALRNGLYDAKAGQEAYQQGRTSATTANTVALADAGYKAAQTRKLDRQGDYTVVGNNILDNATGEFMQPPTTPSETERLIDKWRTLQAANPSDPLLPLLERAIKGYQYTAPVINAQAEARTRTGTAVAAARGAQARLTKRTAGASSARGGGGKAAKLPAGFILNP